MNLQRSAPYIYIETDSALKTLLPCMKRADRIALDTEADSLHHYFEKVCLIQLTLDGDSYIVDPLSGADLSEFLYILADTPLIFHGADYDVRMLRITFGFQPRREVYDTMLAAHLLGYDQVGLVALVERFFGIMLTKRGRKSDWSRRPLTREQLEYASDDTRYLELLADRLFSELHELGRWDWYLETCASMLRSAVREKLPRDSNDEWRIKGLSSLDSRKLAFVRELWYWREEEAKRGDLPPFKIMGNRPMIDLAVWAASHPRDLLNDGPRLPRHIRGRRFAALRRAIRNARNTPRSRWPEHHTSSRPPYVRSQWKPLTERLQTVCSRVASELGIASPVLASRSVLETIARNRPKTIDALMDCGLMRWQAELLKPGIERILERFEVRPRNSSHSEPQSQEHSP